MDEWISVKERLPKQFGWHLVHIRGWVTMAWFDADGWGDFQTCVAKPEQVTHWMPLPEPPQDGGEEDRHD